MVGCWGCRRRRRTRRRPTAARRPASASVERKGAAAGGWRDRPWRTSPGVQTEHPFYLTGAGPVPFAHALLGERRSRMWLVAGRASVIFDLPGATDPT